MDLTKITKKLYILFLSVFLHQTTAYSQNEQLSLSNYTDAIQYYNPSAVGFYKTYSISAFHNITKIKRDSLSHNTLFLLNIPVKLGNQYFGAGGEINMRNVGVWQNTEFCLSFSWIKQIDKLKISVGNGVIFRKCNIKENENIDTKNSPNINIPKGSTKGVDFSFGITFEGYNTLLSISSRNILNRNLMLGDISLPMERNYNFMGLYDFEVPSYKLSFIPSLYFSTNDKLQYNAGVDLTSWYNNFLYFSLGYLINDSFRAGIGSRFKDFKFGYSIGIPQHKINDKNWCTQEIFVSYQTNMFFENKKDNIRKSIRLL